MDSTSAFVLVSCVAVSTPLAVAGVRAYRECGGFREVGRTGTMEKAILRVQTTRAMLAALLGREDVRVRSSAVFPEKLACPSQASDSPLSCVVPPPAPKTRTPPPEPWRC
jgi:hypothetical protein